MSTIQPIGIIQTWASGKSLAEQVIILAEKVRDIPYGDIGSRDPLEVYHNNQGTCSGKHELLKLLYHELGIKTRDMIAMHRFKDMPVQYPSHIQDLLQSADIIDPHNFFQIERNGKWISVDITWDKPLKKLGFIVNEEWDGYSDMEICVVSHEIFEVENPIEFKTQKIDTLPEEVKRSRKLFLEELTAWLTELRNNGIV